MAFVSDIDKNFYHLEGEVVAFELEKKILLFKIIKVDKINLQKGKTYNIAGIEIVAPMDDFFLCVPINIAKAHYENLEQAIQSLQNKEVTWILQMSPMRPSGIYSTPIFKTNFFEKIHEEELQAYEIWKSEFLKGKAGVW
jgi:hypothetical protein